MTCVFYVSTLFCINSCSADTSSEKTQYSSLMNYDRDIENLLDLKKLDKGKVSIFIEKSKYTLTLRYDGLPVKIYPVVFGFNPVDDKLYEGDGCMTVPHF